MAALAASVMAALLVGTELPGVATAASTYCNQSAPNDSLLFYRSDNGQAGTGTLVAGQWQQTAARQLPAGYTHAAASRDSLLLYNANTGTGESGTFTNGTYTRVQTYDDFSTGWSDVEATGDSVLFYQAGTGKGGTGTLKGGVYQEVRQYDDFAVNWGSIAGSCDTMAFASGQGQATGDLGYGTLQNGVYQHVGDRQGEPSLGSLVATRDTALALAPNGSQLQARVASATDGRVGSFQTIGTTGIWEDTGRTSDSVFFYRSDGTAWTSTLSGGTYANVGPVANVSSGWTLIEGGV